MSDDVKAAYRRGRKSGIRFAVKHPKFIKATKRIVPFIIYLAISCIYLRPTLSDLHNNIFNSSPDPEQFVWFLNWWPYALVHHLNPFITKFVWYPGGYNLAWATSIPGLGLLMAPVTLLGGAVLSFNLLVLLSPPLSALTCFYLVYAITKRFTPSLIGGYIYGFSTFEMAQLVGHPQMYVNFLVPLIVLLCWGYFKGKIRRIPFIAVTGVLLALQFTISNEIYATFVMFLTLAAVVFYIFGDPTLKQKLIVLGKHFYLAVGISLVLVSPYLYYMATGYRNLPRVIHSLSQFSSDTLNFVVPTPATWLGGTSPHIIGIAEHFTGNFSEDGAYIGLPLLVILGYLAVRYRRKAYMLAMSVLLALLALFSLGPKLHIAGHTGHFGHIIGIPLPWIIPEHLPIIKSALPDRFTMYIFLLAAIIISIWLSMKTSRRNQSLKYASVLASIIFIVPTTSIFSWVHVPVPTIFHASQVANYIPKGSNVLILPYGRRGSDMYYQYKSGMWFTQAGGYVGAPPKVYTGSPVLHTLLTGVPKAGFDKQLQRFCQTNRVTKIIYLHQTSPALARVAGSLGWPSQKVDNATVVSVPTN